MKHFYANVPRLGDVELSRHVIRRMHEQGISEELLVRVLLDAKKPDIPDGQDVLLRERNGVRLVILRHPVPYRGRMLVKTVYKVKPPSVAKRR